MKNVLRGALAVVMLLGLAANVPGASAHPTTRQSADVYTFAGLPDLVGVGDARLVRNPRGIVTTASVQGADPGVYTLWWVVWNNPAACGDDGCTAADFGRPGVNVDIGYADGDLVDRRGHVRMHAALREGQELRGFPSEFGITSGDGLLDAESAEVHLVLRSHGPRIPGATRDMLRTFNGGCVYPEGIPAEYGQPGPNACEDTYFAVFP